MLNFFHLESSYVKTSYSSCGIKKKIKPVYIYFLGPENFNPLHHLFATPLDNG